MNGWKEVLSIFAVTISVGLLIGMLLLINSTKKIDKSQQEIRQETLLVSKRGIISNLL